MANVITTKDGRNHTLFDERDLFWLVEEYMGDEAVRWIKDFVESVEYDHSDDADYIKELEQEAEQRKAHYKEVMKELREQSGIIAGLIRAKDIDRGRLSTAAGKIGTITWRELNV